MRCHPRASCARCWVPRIAAILLNAQAAAAEAVEQHLIEADHAVFLKDLLDFASVDELRRLYRRLMDHASRSWQRRTFARRCSRLLESSRVC